MTTQPATKAQVIAALRANGEEFLRTLRALPEETFEQGRYESGWNGRQILAHVAAIEWTYPRLLDIATQARGHSPSDTAALPTRATQGGMDAYNARQVERRAGRRVQDLLDEFERNRAATIAAIEQADDALFAIPITSAGGATGPLANVYLSVAIQHPRGHLNDIIGRLRDKG